MSSPLDPISFNGNNAVFVSELYARYLDGKPGNAVDGSWRGFFEDMHDDVREVLRDMRGPSWAPRDGQVIGNGMGCSMRATRRRTATAPWCRRSAPRRSAWRRVSASAVRR